jgi:hypothetical protein
MSAWSVNALERHTGMSRDKAHLALERLIESGSIKKIRSGCHPQYEIKRMGEPDVLLPNAVVDGVNNEVPPLALLRQMQDVRCLRLFFRIYASSHLPNEAGVSRENLSARYEMVKLCERGALTIWAFRSDGIRFAAAHFYFEFLKGTRDEDGEDIGMADFWLALSQLERTGLIEFIPHLLESESADAEILHAYPIGATGEEWERDTSLAAHSTAKSLLPAGYEEWEQSGDWLFLALPSHIAKLAVIGIARQRYRAKTARTAAWVAISKEKSEAWKRRYEALQGDLIGSSPVSEFGRLQHKRI